jgi:hypothetical protein
MFTRDVMQRLVVFYQLNTGLLAGWRCCCCCAAGLGTSTAKEAKEYFAAMDQHKKNFVWEGELHLFCWGSTQLNYC